MLRQNAHDAQTLMKGTHTLEMNLTKNCGISKYSKLTSCYKDGYAPVE